MSLSLPDLVSSGGVLPMHALWEALTLMGRWSWGCLHTYYVINLVAGAAAASG